MCKHTCLAALTLVSLLYQKRKCTSIEWTLHFLLGSYNPVRFDITFIPLPTFFFLPGKAAPPSFSWKQKKSSSHGLISDRSVCTGTDRFRWLFICTSVTSRIPFLADSGKIFRKDSNTGILNAQCFRFFCKCGFSRKACTSGHWSAPVPPQKPATFHLSAPAFQRAYNPIPVFEKLTRQFL